MIKAFNNAGLGKINWLVFYSIFFTFILYFGQTYSQTNNFNTGNIRNSTNSGQQKTQGIISGNYPGSVFHDDVNLISDSTLIPPTELVALTGYNSNIPLAWQIPVGVPIPKKVSGEKYSQIIYEPGNTAAGSDNKSIILPASSVNTVSSENNLNNKSSFITNIASFTGYNVYRSTSLNGPFTIIANNISRQYYNDINVINGQTYYYRVTAVYNEGESEPTSVVNAVPQQGGYDISSKWANTAPTIDGHIDNAEWNNAASFDVTYPDASGSVTVKVMNDSVNLYIAVDDARDTHLDNLDQFAFIFDENYDRNWPSNSPSGEGFIWIYWNDSAQVSACLWGGRYGYWPYNIGLESNVIPSGVMHGISNSTGHVQYEASYNLVNSPLNVVLGSKIGICLFTYDYTPKYFNALWPQQVERLKNITPNIYGWGTGPFSFGTLTLESPPNPVLTVSPLNQTVSYTSDSTTFTVTSNVNWSVSDNASWLTENPTSGRNNGNLMVHFEANTTTSQRVGTITISGGGIIRQVTVTQAATPAPEIATSVSSLQDFGNITIGQTSQSQTYTVSGNNLTDNIVITSPPGFQISLNGSDGYTNILTLIPSLGAVAYTNIYVRFSPTEVRSYSGNITHKSTGATKQNVAVIGIGAAVPVPEIITSVSSLQDFGNITTGLTSQSQTYTVSGNNLTDDIVITAPPEFQISLNGSGGYSNTLSLTPSLGAVAYTTIYVRFSPTEVRSYSANITHTSTGATEKDIAISGTGSAVPVPEIMTSLASLEDFGTLTIGQMSPPKTYTVSGINLTDNIFITAPAGFQISLTGSDGYTDTLSLIPSLGAVAYTIIYVRFGPTEVRSYSANIKHTSTGATEKDVAVSGTGSAVPVPEILTSMASLEDFGTIAIGQTSPYQTYTVSGNNLTDNIVITAPTGFQVSLNGSGGYTNTLTLTPSLGAVAYTTIYVRFNPTEVRSYSGNLTHTSTGATEKDISVSGAGAAVPVPEIITSVSSLDDFGNITIGQISSSQTYTVSGNNLTDNIVITAPEGFQLALNGSGGYTNTLTLTPSLGAVANTNVYVRFFPTFVQPYSSSIKHYSTGAAQKDVMVNGTGFIDYPSQIPVFVSYSFPNPTEISNYRIIGIPGDNNLPIGNIIKGVDGSNGDWRAFWDPGNGDYIEYNGSSLFNFTPGKAFWIISRNSINIDENVKTVALSEDNSYAIPLHNEWNLISNPFNKDIAWDNVRNANPGLSELIYRYVSGNYDTSNTFGKNMGYYFYNNPALSMNKINIPYITIDSSIFKPKFNTPGGLGVNLTLKDKIMGEIFIDFSEHAKLGLDYLDKFSPPDNFCEINLALYNSGFKTNYKYLRKEYRPAIGEGQEYVIVVKNLSNEVLFLKTKGLENFGEYEVYLLDNDYMQLYDLKKQNEVTVKGNTAGKKFDLFIGTKEYCNHVKTGLVPVKFRLYQNYPNPFNPNTIVRFSLPEACKINIKIYNVLGEMVKTLIDNRQYNTGNYSVEFNGKSLPSGIYIIRMSTQHFVDQKKMILLK